MKQFWFTGSIVSLVLVLTVFVACAPAAPAPPTPASTQAPSKPQAKDEWDSVVAAARSQADLTIYAANIGDAREVIIKTLKDKYGINCDIFTTGRAADIVEKIDRERKAGLYLVDAGFFGLTSFYNQVQPMNIAVPLDPMMVLPEVKDPTKWRGGQIPFADAEKTAIAMLATAAPHIVINTDMVKASEIVSNNDLLAPQWKGKIVINDPTIAGNGNEWFSYIMLVAYQRQDAEQYMKKLIAQEPVVLRDQRLQVEWVARGKYPVAIAPDQAQTSVMMHTGAPLKFIKAKEGAPVTPGGFVMNAFNRAPHPDTLKFFINWLLSKEGITLISPAGGYPSQRVDVSNASFDPMLVPSATDVLPGKEYQLQKGEMTKIAAELFKGLIQ